MKLACKRYGDAWSSGSLGAVRAATTAEFGNAWARLPRDIFASLPRAGGGDVLHTSKGRGTGVVQVMTSEGVVHFHVVGSGFNWTVADIHKRNDEGALVSLRDTLNAACTMREFAAIFTNPKDTRSLDSHTSKRFQQALAAIPDATLERIRTSMKRVKPPARPTVHFRNFGAVVTVPVSESNPQERVVFHVVNQNGWKVDDMGFATSRLQVASLRNNIRSLAASSDFGAYCRGDHSIHPQQFTTGELCDELCWFHENGKPFPGNKQGPPHKIAVNAKNEWIEAFWQDKRAVFVLKPSSHNQVKIHSVKIVEEGEESDLTTLLANYRRIQGIAESQPAIKLLGLVLDTGHE